MEHKKTPPCISNTSTPCVIHDEALENKIKYSRILEYSFEEIYIFCSRTLKFTEVSRGAQANLGYSIDELVNISPVDIKPALSESVFQSILGPLKSGEEDIARFSTVHQRKDGSQYDVDVRVQYVPSHDPVFIAMVTDVTERNLYEQELKALAFRDPGTDLYNRRYFCEQMAGTINHANRMNSSIGLVLIDMDDFGAVNNEYGHLMGDKIIIEFTNKIKKVFSRKTDVVARYGGDEFVVMCVNNTEETLLKKCNELIKLFNKPFYHNGKNIIQTASIGICVRDGISDPITPEDLIEGADSAMYEVKDTGKNSVRICNNEVK